MLELLTIGLFAVACIGGLSRPSWALALMILLFPLKQGLQGSSTFFLANFTLPNYISAIVIGLSAVLAVAKMPSPMRGYACPQFVVGMLLYIWSAVTLVWTPSYITASDYVVTNIPYLILYLVVSPLLLRDVVTLSMTLRVTLFIGTTLAITMLLNPAFTSQSGRLGVQLSSSVRTNPLVIGEFGGTLMIIASLLHVNRATAVLGSVRIAAFIAGAILAIESGSRGQLLFAAILAIVFYPISKRVRDITSFVTTAVVVAVLAAGVLAIAAWTLQGQGLRRWDADLFTEGVGIRTFNFVQLLAEWAQHPLAWLFGLGFNAFSSLGSAEAALGYSHNLPADILAELGLPMFVLFCMMLWDCVKCSRALFVRYSDYPEERSTVAILLAISSYQLLLVNKQGMLWASPSLFLWAILLGRLCRRARPEHHGEPEDDGDMPTAGAVSG
jgi:hypothetical protein